MKRFISLLLILCCFVALASCGGEAPSYSDSDSESVPETPDYPPYEEPEAPAAEPNLVMVAPDGEHLGVYDMDLFEEGMLLEDCLVWSCKDGLGGDMKYREDTVFGDVIVTTGGGRANMISYPKGEILWETDNPGNNPHSIEILPSGNIIVASSTGATLRLFYTSALLEEDKKQAQKFEEYVLDGAHGVLYDPEYGVVWALGNYELAAYRITEKDGAEKLSKIDGMGVRLPGDSKWGHDLSADYTSVDHLYLTTDSDVFRFDKENNELIEKFPQYAKLSRETVKGFSNNRNGTFFISYPNGGPGTDWEHETKADWCTDRLYFTYWKTENFMYVQEVVSDGAAFYKIRAFVGQYQ